MDFYHTHDTKASEASVELKGRYKTLCRQWVDNMNTAREAWDAANNAWAAADRIAALAVSYHDAIEKLTGESLEADFSEPEPRRNLKSPLSRGTLTITLEDHEPVVLKGRTMARVEELIMSGKTAKESLEALGLL